MGQWKHKLWTRVDDAEFEFVNGIGAPLLQDKSEKLRILIRACLAWVTAGKVRLSLDEVQEQLRQREQLCQSSRQVNSEAGYSDAAGVACESGKLPLPPKKPLEVCMSFRYDGEQFKRKAVKP